jgi:hypothetical protein
MQGRAADSLAAEGMATNMADRSSREAAVVAGFTVVVDPAAAPAASTAVEAGSTVVADPTAVAEAMAADAANP